LISFIEIKSKLLNYISIILMNVSTSL